MRLAYTWRDCFAKTVRDIKATDLIEHSIDLEPHARPIKGTLPKYTPQEREFANRIFPELEDAGIIVRRSSPWGARTKFPPKKKGSELLRVVHNYKPVNSFTIKSAYPMHHLEEVVGLLIKPKYKVYFSSDASNGYWAIMTRPQDQNKTGFLTPNGQWVYLRMVQGLKRAPHTYSQFTDLVFGPLPPNDDGAPRMPTLIGDNGDVAFAAFMDDHGASATDYDTLFDFLHTRYFPRVAFGPVYLSGHKKQLFSGGLELLGFQGSEEGLRPSLKHREKIRNWPTPRNREELDAFLWLTPFLRIFIPGRSDLVLEMKKAYLTQVPVELKPKKPHDDEVEDCDQDLTRAPKRKRAPKPTVQRKWVEKETFDWGLRQQAAFDAVKQAVSNNAMAGADPELQYHLSVDASQTGVGGCLFQLAGISPGTEATPKLEANERITMFMSFRLQDAQTRYGNSERECYAIVKCLSEVRWMVMGSPHPVIVYSDHEALKSIFATGQTEKNRIANWLDRLGEYDIKLAYRPSRDQHIGIADGLSRMPTRFTTQSNVEDSEMMAMAVLPEHRRPLQQHTRPLQILEPLEENLNKYKRSPMYHQVVEYLVGGEDAMEAADVPRSRRKYLRKAAKAYRLPNSNESRSLRFIENNGSVSICIVEDEVSRFLQAAHEDHGHYAPALTLDYLIGRV